MLSDREAILQQALGLPPADRAFVAAALEQSLGNLPPDAIAANDSAAVAGAELLTELQRRSASFRSGHTAARAADEALADLRRR
jgi:hypothetical protein